MAETLGAVGLDRYTAFARFLASASVEECASLYAALGPGGEPSTFTRLVFSRWAELDPKGALRAARYPLDGRDGWAHQDPEAALAYGLERNRDPLLVQLALKVISDRDPQRGEAILREHPELATESFHAAKAATLGRSDPRAAAEYALAYSVGLNGTMGRWAKQDPDGALTFALGQRDARDRSEALAEVLGTLAGQEPTRALDIADKLPAGRMRQDLITNLLESIAISDPTLAVARARALTLPGDRMRAMESVAKAICFSAPDTALALFAEAPGMNVYDGQWGDPGLARSFASVRPKESLALCAAFPESANRIAYYWTQEHPEHASTWIGEQPPGPTRDAMVKGHVTGLLEDSLPDFHSATAWALSLDSGETDRFPDKRWVVLEGIFNRWLDLDRAAALGAMRLEGMPAEAAALLERDINRER